MQTTSIGAATVTVENIGRDYHPQDSDYRQRYAYSIVSADWRYDGDDIRSGCGAPVDEPEALRTLFSFLGAAAESVGRDYSDNADLFPQHVSDWAAENSDEISMASLDPNEFE